MNSVSLVTKIVAELQHEMMMVDGNRRYCRNYVFCAYLAAALDVAHSPSLCAIRCIAVGAMQIGDETRSPRTVVSVILMCSR